MDEREDAEENDGNDVDPPLPPKSTTVAKKAGSVTVQRVASNVSTKGNSGGGGRTASAASSSVDSVGDGDSIERLAPPVTKTAAPKKKAAVVTSLPLPRIAPSTDAGNGADKADRRVPISGGAIKKSVAGVTSGKPTPVVAAPKPKTAPKRNPIQDNDESSEHVAETPAPSSAKRPTTKIATSATTKIATSATTKIATSATTKIATSATTKVATSATTKIATSPAPSSAQVKKPAPTFSGSGTTKPTPIVTKPLTSVKKLAPKTK
jgi:hypothetical protein